MQRLRFNFCFMQHENTAPKLTLRLPSTDVDASSYVSDKDESMSCLRASVIPWPQGVPHKFGSEPCLFSRVPDARATFASKCHLRAIHLMLLGIFTHVKFTQLETCLELDVVHSICLSARAL